MNFTVGSKEEIIKAAEQAEYTGGNFVKEPGAYFGPIESFMFKKFPSGAGGVEVVIKTEEGLSCKAMLITMTKTGSSTYKNAKGEALPLPGVNQITGGIMPILQMKELTGVEDKDGNVVYQTAIGKKIGMLVNIRKTNGTGKNADKVYENADLKAFFCPMTDRTGSEIMAGVQSGQGVKKAKLMEGLTVVDETNKEDNQKNNTDPFGDGAASDDSAGADPFASDNNASETADPFAGDSAAEPKEAAKEEAKQEEVKETPAEPETKAEETTSSNDEAGDFWN